MDDPPLVSLVSPSVFVSIPANTGEVYDAPATYVESSPTVFDASNETPGRVLHICISDELGLSDSRGGCDLAEEKNLRREF